MEDRLPGFVHIHNLDFVDLNSDLDTRASSMATYQIPPPAPLALKGDMVENVKAFKAAWNNWILATGLKDRTKKADGSVDPEGEKVVAATLLSIVGPEAVRIVNTLPKFTETIKDSPSLLLEAIELHFVPERHVLFERFKFNTATQTENENIDSFVVRLRTLVRSCEYLALEDSILRDRLVIGTRDDRSRDRLLRERPVPDLQRCVDVLKAAELSKFHLASGNIHDPGRDKEVHALQQRGQRATDTAGNKGRSRPRNQENKKPDNTNNNNNLCAYCGTRHRKGRCPAYGTTCESCGGRNHLAKVCWGRKKKQVHQTELDTEPEESEPDLDQDDYVFAVERIGAVTSQEQSKFFAKVKFKGNKPMWKKVQLDTGATCSAMSIGDLKEVLQDKKLNKEALKPTRGMIKLYDGRTVRPLGSYPLELEVNGQTQHITFDILEKAPWPIIDGATCMRNGWITLEINTVTTSLTKSGPPDSLTKDLILEEYSDVFTGLGCLPGEYHIDVDPNITPVQHAPRRVPVPLKEKLKVKIDELEAMGIIRRVKGHSDWISSLVAVQKVDKLRVCIDPRDLNKAIRRPKHIIPTIDELLPNLAKAKVFSVLDAKDGFFQIKLDEASTKLTTFWTPFGKYCWLRCPFGISSAPEEYQRRQQEVLKGLKGVDVIADDIICFGSGETKEEAEVDHDKNVRALLERAREFNLKLNGKKLRFKQRSVPYMGHLLTEQGIQPDPNRIEAIKSLPKPDSAKAVQRLLGSVNYLARFLPRLSEAAEPLRRLTKEDVPWHWESHQERAYHQILELMAKAPVLRYYDVGREVTIQSDASMSGLGAVLLQEGQPVSFASRTLSATEQNYAQIEKECLSIVFACERFDQYLHGRDLITAQTDHKPLVSVWNKSIHQVPKRLQRMLMRLQKYHLQLEYVPGSKMYISDMLSRAALPQLQPQEESVPPHYIFQIEQEEELREDIASVNQADHMNLSKGTQDLIQRATLTDPTLQLLAKYIMLGWPEDRERTGTAIREYWNIRDELTIHDGILYKGMKVIIPKTLQKDMINKAHSSHLGQEASIRRARDVLFWPGMAAEIREKVQQCSTCNEYQAKQQKEPMMSHKIPDYPWAKIGQDLFHFRGKNYLVTVDFYSDFFEVNELEDLTANNRQHHHQSDQRAFRKTWDSRHGHR
jgi:hypothetical protein